MVTITHNQVFWFKFQNALSSIKWCDLEIIFASLRNLAPVALQRASAGQPPHGGLLPLSHWVGQRWAAKWASRGPKRIAFPGFNSFIP